MGICFVARGSSKCCQVRSVHQDVRIPILQHFPQHSQLLCFIFVGSWSFLLRVRLLPSSLPAAFSAALLHFCWLMEFSSQSQTSSQFSSCSSARIFRRSFLSISSC